MNERLKAFAFLLAIPGALWNSMQIWGMAKDKWGRKDMPKLGLLPSQRHPILFHVVMAATLACLAAGISFAVSPSQSTNPGEHAQVFSGIVKDPSGHPIPRAHIQITLDQMVPQSASSDSTGVFHVDIPPTVRSMHISIDAKDFEVFELDANPKRTGPEIIYLTPRAGSLHGANHTPLKPGQPDRKPIGTPSIGESIRTTTQLTANPPVQQCIGSNCIGTNFGSAVVNNYGPAPIPDRVITQDGGDRAIAVLEVAKSKGYKIRIDCSGLTKESGFLIDQIINLFSSKGWSPFRGELAGSEQTMIDGVVTHGEGIACQDGTPEASSLARRALSAAGIQCGGTYFVHYADRLPADFYIKIGPK